MVATDKLCGCELPKVTCLFGNLVYSIREIRKQIMACTQQVYILIIYCFSLVKKFFSNFSPRNKDKQAYQRIFKLTLTMTAVFILNLRPKREHWEEKFATIWPADRKQAYAVARASFDFYWGAI